MKFTRGKRVDLWVITIIFLVASLIGYIQNWKPLEIALPALVLPPLYLFIREKKNYLKILVSVLVFGIVYAFIFDFIIYINHGWVVTRPVFPYHLFGFYPIIDEILGYMIMTFFIITFYEHFLDDYRSKQIAPHVWYTLRHALILSALIVIIYLLKPSFLTVPYVYLVLGALAVIRPIKICFKHPKFIQKFALIGTYFFFIWFITELVCLANNGWYFPGQYLGIVDIAGLRFPIEEFVFWFMLYAATITAYFESSENNLSA